MHGHPSTRKSAMLGCVPVSAVKERKKIGFPGSTRGKQFFANKPLDASNKHALVLEVVDEAVEETRYEHWEE